MATNDSLLNVSQNIFSPDIVQKISDVIGQSAEKTKNGLMSVVPTFISGIIDKGATLEGATTLVEMVKSHDYESTVAPDETKLIEGNEVVKNIFENNFNYTVSNLVTSSGLSAPSITKMLGLVAPIIMGVLGSKVKNEKLSSSGLINYLNQEKNLLDGFSNKTSEYYSLSGQDPQIDIEKRIAQPVPWKTIILISLILIAIVFWWQAVQINSAMS